MAKLGVLVTLAEPASAMRKVALSSGYFRSPAQGDFAKLQIVTIGELLRGNSRICPGRRRRRSGAPNAK